MQMLVPGHVGGIKSMKNGFGKRLTVPINTEDTWTGHTGWEATYGCQQCGLLKQVKFVC